MSVAYRLVRKLRNLVGTQQILEPIKSIYTSLLSAYQRRPLRKGTSVASVFDNMQILPGTPYQRYLLPLDYLPSCDYKPRWGYAHPPHGGLMKQFARNAELYRRIIEELRTLRHFLQSIRKDFTHEAAPEPGWVGGPINALDLALLYYFVWKYQPRTYLEIGSGISTCFARRAITDHNLATRIVSIDPEPRASIDLICDKVIRGCLETVDDLSIFEHLEPGDVVFVDGSHRCFMNSDVTVFMLDVLPLLKPGVIVHFHDFLLPYDYPDSFKNWYWNEQYVLGVYLLAAADRVKILLPSHYLSRAEGLRDCLVPPIVAIEGQSDTWLQGGSIWFTHVDNSD